MIFNILKLKDYFKTDLIGEDATLAIYSRSNSREIEPARIYPTVLICPGGGYSMTSDREAEPVALAFLNKGFSAAILRYSCAPSRYPVQLVEASAAMAILKRSNKWNINNEKIAVCGFSAGGHVAASLGTLFNEPVIFDELKIKIGENRPHAMILSYPVISAGTYAHRGSFDNLLGKNSDPDLLFKLSLENSVDKDTAPAFIWHTADDTAVPVENSFLMAAALKNADVPYELHIYKSGLHGLSMADITTAGPQSPQYINTNIAGWFGLAIDWLLQI